MTVLFPQKALLLTLAMCFCCLSLTFRNSASANPNRSAAVPTDSIGDDRSLDDTARPSSQTVLHLTFALQTDSQPEVQAFLASQINSASPNFHKWITPTQFGQSFGASFVDISSVTNYLASLGLANVKVWPDRQFISADATRSQAESAFGVKIHGYDRPSLDVARGLSATYYAPDSEPIVSQAIANSVVGIFGLSDAAERIPNAIRSQSFADGGGTVGLSPAQLAQVYDISALHNSGLEGQGETIAIYSPTAFRQSDIDQFFSNNNITLPTINIVNVDGGTTNLANEDEACIDIETSGAQAPSATINVYEGPNNGNFDILDKIESDDPNIVSISYGIEEDEVSASYAASYESIRQAMSAAGITIFVASGDQGAYSSLRPLTIGCAVDATSAYVTAVGGTELSPLNDGAWNGEVAWTFNDGTLGADTGSGGGLSIYYPEPSWQTGPGVANSNSNGMRQIPDVASLASSPYYEVFADGEAAAFGGTSCPTPLWAGSMALIEQNLGTRLGNIDPMLYSIGTNDASVYHDITSGNNGAYACTPGWDFVTGWGSTDFGSLLSAFQTLSEPAVPAPTITPDGGAFSTAQSVTLSDSSTGATIYYTADGTAPTTSSMHYTAPFTVSTTETITAFAIESNDTNSSVTSASFTIGHSVPAPTITPDGGGFGNAQSVTITDSLSGASIYYTTDGSTPTNSSTLYTGPITVSTSETITAIAAGSGYSNSSPVVASFTISTTVPAPTITPDGGSYQNAQSVTLSDSLAGASIYYTTDGTTPTAGSTLYSSPITVTASETITAIATAFGDTNSPPASASFTIVMLVPPPTFSPNGGTFTAPQSVTLSDTLSGATIYYTTDGSTPTTSSSVYTTPITVSTTETINAIAVVAGLAISAPSSAVFTINPPVVASFSPGLQMISLPESYPGVSLDSLFGYTGVKLAVWTPTDVSYALTPTAPANQIVLGQGYWVRFPQAISVTQQGTLASTASPFVVQLQPGWNMIGDPYPTAVPVTSIEFDSETLTFAQAASGTNPLIGGTVYEYNASSNLYSPASTLSPDLGYWIYDYAATDMDVISP
jgi:subtilase family serine protease